MDLHFALHPAQLKIFNDKRRFKVVAAGRRFGKSYLSCVNLLIEGLKSTNERGYSLADKRVFYVAPTFDQGKRIIWDLIKILGEDVIKSTLENQAIITLINGRKIEIKGADRPDSLRGVGLSYVVLDEYAFMKPDVWETIIRPTLADVEGRALFIGTPSGKNHFYDLYMEGEKYPDDWACFSFNSTDNPTLNPKEIEVARDTMSAHAFRQEFEASFSATGGGIFKEEYIKYSDEEPKDGFFYISVDPAGYGDVINGTKSKINRLDETAISIVKVHQGGWWVKEIDHGRWGIRETSLRIIKHSRDVKAMAVGIEKGALKNAIMPYLSDQMRRLNTFPNIVETTHGGQNKILRITWALQGRFEHGRIVLNKGRWTRTFINQLLDFPNPLSHDDLIDSLAYIDQVATTAYHTELTDADQWEPLDIEAGF